MFKAVSIVRFVKLILIPVCSVLIAALALCSRDYNPFSDPENCDMHIVSRTFNDKDTLAIFSTETLSVMFTAPGFVKSFTVETEKNKFFDHGEKWCVSSGNGKHTVLFSFWDTGLVKIRFYMEKTTGGTRYEEMSCYIRSPLVNSRVWGGFDSMHLQHFKTEKVSDEGVIYQWIFGNNKQIDLTTADTQGLFIDWVNDTGTGIIRVTDGKHTSSGSLFKCQLVDLTPPQLAFLDSGEIRGDTMICNGDAFYKIIKITDPGSGKVAEVKINDTSIAEMDKIIKKFPSDIGEISFYMKDGSPNGNNTTVRYFVKIDSAYSGNNGNIQFKLLFPGDQDTINSEKVHLFVQVERLDRQKLHHTLSVKVNNVVVDSADLSDSYISQQMFPVEISLPENKIKTELYDQTTGKLIDSVESTIYFDRNYKKDAMPVILDVQYVNTRVSRGQIITSRDYVDVRVVAFDDKGAVQKINIGETVLVCEKNGYQWNGKIQLLDKYNRDSIVAIDSTGNKTVTLFEIVKNSHPILVNGLNKKVQIAVGDSYRDTMVVYDADRDSITYGLIDNTGKSITVGSRSGIVHWEPAISEKNSNGYLFKFSANDTYDEVTDSTLIFVFSDSSEFIAPVDFKTTPSEISTSVESGKEYKYKLELKKGLKGVFFNVRTDMDSVYLSVDTLIVKPQLYDTGYHKVVVIAVNQLDFSDTLYTDFIVMPPNRKPFFNDSVFYTDGKPGITVIGGIDSFISFPLIIDDLDSADRNGIKISSTCALNNIKVQLNSNRSYDLVLFNPNMRMSEDTITLICEDKGGLRDTLILPVHYVRKIFPVEYITPENGEYLMNDTVRFLWKKAGNVADVVYTLLIDGIAGAISSRDTTASKKFLRSDTYRWKIIASSGIDSVVGEWRSFTVRVPGHIQFKTTEKELKKYCFAGVDTYAVQLHIKDGTGTAGNKFSAVLRGRITDTITVTDKGMLTWIPESSDTGVYELIVFAMDTAGNSDTLRTHLSVVSASSCVVNILCEDSSLYCENAVDLYGDVKETQLFIDLTRSGNNGYDTFNLDITSHGYSANVDADSVVIHLKRPDGIVSDDTLLVVVRNKSLKIPPVRDTVIIRYSIPTRTVNIAAGQLNLTDGLSDVPVLLRLDDNNIGFAKKCGFRFLTNNNLDTLDYQINSWDPQNKKTEIWVHFDTILPAVNNTCIMQYGYQLPDKSNGGEVFDTLNNFNCVYHFEENERNVIVNDATYSGNNGIFNNIQYFPSEGISGNSVLLQEANHTKLTVSKNMLFDDGEAKTFMMESWIKRLQAVNNINYLFTIKIRDSLQCGLLIENGALKAYYECYENNVRKLIKGAGSPLPSGEWKRVSFIATIQEKQISYLTYVNTDKVVEDVMEPPVQIITWTSGSMVFGTKGDVNISTDNQTFNGNWDEIWITDKSRSEDWIRFMYESQKLTGSIISVHN